MRDEVLKVLLENKDCEYFILERKDNWYDSIRHQNVSHCSLVLVGLTNNIYKILDERTIDEITFKEVREIEDTYIERNIYIYPNYAPFQLGIRPFNDAVDLMPFRSEEISLVELLSNNFEYVYQVKKFIEEKSKTKNLE